MYLMLTALLAAVIGVAWAALTHANQMPWPAVIGLALVAAAIATLTERTVHIVRVRRARGTAVRRAHARPRARHPRKAA